MVFLVGQGFAECPDVFEEVGQRGFKRERVLAFVTNRQLYVGLPGIEFEAFPALSFHGFRGCSSAGLSPALRTLIPLEDVPTGPGSPFDSSPSITVERDVFPAGIGLDLAGDVDSCH